MKLVLVFCMLFLISCTSTSRVEEKPWCLKIVPTGSHSKNGSSIGIYSTASLVLTNRLNSSQTIWQEWCSWGYYNVHFEIEFDDGQSYKINKKDREWTRNFPSLYLIRQGEHYVYPIKFSDDKWQGFPKNWKRQKVKMKAIYEVKETKESKKYGVWTGKVESDYYEVTLRN